MPPRGGLGRRTARASALALILGLALLGCPAEEPNADTHSADLSQIERAQEALGPIKRDLKKALLDAMAEGGPQTAISVCKVKAPGLAAAASKNGLTVGRTSDRLRNPANAPREWVTPLLSEMSTVARADAAPRSVELPGGGLGYVAPIYTDGLCLVCHGDPAPEIAAELDRSYPEDRARGYRADEFRGLFWVEVAP
ncbi:MAG: c-type heme family protein [Planctomycetota bacterium]